MWSAVMGKEKVEKEVNPEEQPNLEITACSLNFISSILFLLFLSPLC